MLNNIIDQGYPKKIINSKDKIIHNFNIKLCLTGAPFSGKKSLAALLLEKYPGLKIIKTSELTEECLEAVKFSNELNIDKKDKPIKKEAAVEEKEAQLKELLDDTD